MDQVSASTSLSAAATAAAGLDRLKDCERATEIGAVQKRSLAQLRGATELLKASNDAGEKELLEEVEPLVHEYETKLIDAASKMRALARRVRGLKTRVFLAQRAWQEHALREAEK